MKVDVFKLLQSTWQTSQRLGQRGHLHPTCTNLSLPRYSLFQQEGWKCSRGCDTQVPQHLLNLHACCTFIFSNYVFVTCSTREKLPWVYSVNQQDCVEDKRLGCWQWTMSSSSSVLLAIVPHTTLNYFPSGTNWTSLLPGARIKCQYLPVFTSRGTSSVLFLHQSCIFVALAD